MNSNAEKPYSDLFSKQSEDYKKYRPSYPMDLIEFIVNLCVEKNIAWDCGTGNGQCAWHLADFFETVIASDPSESQIANAFKHPKINYRIEKAERSTLNSESVDLVTAAQSVHWFHLDSFYAEIKRVLKPGGVVAFWCYGLPSCCKNIDEVIHFYHDHTVGKFWQDENRLIDKKYATIPFPFNEVKSPVFTIRKEMDLENVRGWLKTWSATQKFADHFHHDPVPDVIKMLEPKWSNPSQTKLFEWKIHMRVGIYH